MTATGKANVKKTVIDDVIKLKRQEAKSFGLARQQSSGVGSVSVLGGSGMKGGSDSNENTSTGLNTSGGTMMGPIAFYPKVTSIVGGVLDVGIDVNTVTPANAYSSRVICLGGATLGAAVDINTIANAAFAGQILYLQCVATTFLTLKHGTGNIFSPTGADVSFSNKEIITLQFDSTSGAVGGDWIISSSFIGGGGTGMTNPATADLDMAAFSIGGAWGGTANTLGIESDIDMNTYDIIDVDRVKFSTIVGSGTALTSTDTGMEAIYSGGSPYGMIVQFPSTNSAIMQIKRGTTEMINISSLGMIFGGDLSMGVHTISNVVDPTAAQDAATKAYVDASSGSGLLASNNIWTGTNDFNGSSTVIGNAGTDVLSINAKMGTDINMSTYDIYGVDRLKFSTTIGSGTPLASTDTGIETLYSSGVPYGMLIQFPSTGSAIMQIKRGVTDMINISSLGILFGDELLMGGFKISNVLDPTAAQDAATKNYVDANLLGTITNDLLPSPTDTWDLGSTSQRWVELHTASVYFDTFGGRYLKNVGTDIELRTSNTRDIIFSEANALGVSNPFMTLSGVGNNVQFDREAYMNSNKIVSLGTPTASTDAATKGYVDGVAGGANTALSNLVSASVSINADLIPDISDARNLGGSTKYWGSAFIASRMYFDSGINKYIDGITTNDLEFRVPSGGKLIFTEAGTDFYIMDGVANTNVFKRDVHLTAAEAIRADSATEIGYFTTNTIAAVGSRGTVQIPTANQGVTTAAAADAVFGSEIGCCGMFRISGGQALAVKITATEWQILQLGVSGSTATPYII